MLNVKITVTGETATEVRKMQKYLTAALRACLREPIPSTVMMTPVLNNTGDILGSGVVEYHFNIDVLNKILDDLKTK